jgi:senataxin
LDEASQLVEAHIPMVLHPNIEMLIMAGDHMQLPSTVISKAAKVAGFGQSLFESMMNSDYPSFLLDVQYRMHPEISRWPNRIFYDKKLKDGDCVKENYGVSKPWRKKYDPLCLINAHLGKEDYDEHRSTYNTYEIDLVHHITKDIRNLIRKSGESDGKVTSIGILSPYSAQVQSLRYLQSASGSLLFADVHTPN